MEIFVREVRKSKQMTLSELSRRSGVSKAHISYIENKKEIPTIYILCALAKALEVSVCELFSCDNEQQY